MKRLIITITNKSPFSIAASRTIGNVQECLDFIPGTALRGALARVYLKTTPPDDSFREIFMSKKVVFSNCYINGAKPIPLSAYSCKYHSGFLGDRDKHGVVDIVIPLLRERQMGEEMPDSLKHCDYKRDSNATCDVERKRFKGYYKSMPFIKSAHVNKRLIYHTAISHISETAEENALFSKEVVEGGQTFRGEIIVCDDGLLDKVKQVVNSSNPLFLGSDRTAGYGRFEVISCVKRDISEGDLKKTIEDRIEQFNKKLGFNDGRTYFSITLQSDAIITDIYMRYKTFIDAEDIGIPGAELILGMADTRIIQGWNALSRLPKEDVLAIEKGAVFVFAINSLDDNIVDQLFDLERSGIGKRRTEGFGQLTVCDPFHLKEEPK